MSGHSRLGLLDAITHLKGISGGSYKTKVWSGHPDVIVYKDVIWGPSWSTVLKTTLFHSMMTLRK